MDESSIDFWLTVGVKELSTTHRPFQAYLPRLLLNCMIIELEDCIARRWIHSKLVAF